LNDLLMSLTLDHGCVADFSASTQSSGFLLPTSTLSPAASSTASGTMTISTLHTDTYRLSNSFYFSEVAFKSRFVLESTQPSGYQIPTRNLGPSTVTGEMAICTLYINIHCFTSRTDCNGCHSLNRRHWGPQHLLLSFLILKHWDRLCDKLDTTPFYSHTWHPGSCRYCGGDVDNCYCGNPCCHEDESLG